MSRIFKITAAVSIALNVFFLGAVAGIALRYVPPDIMIRDEQRSMLDLLPPEKIQIVYPVLAKSLEDQRQAISQLQGSKATLVALLTAERFDEVKFRAQIMELDRQRGTLGNSVSDLVLAVARHLDATGRIKLARRLEQLPIPGTPPQPSR